MNELLGGLKARYRTAEQRLKGAETEVERASGRRLAQLMGLQPRGRLDHIEDPMLTASDRLKLRRSVAVSLSRRTRDAVKVRTLFLFRRTGRWLRYVPALIILTIMTPIGLIAYTAWKNTDEVVLLQQPIDLNWTLPDGTKERKEMLGGGNLAITRRSGSSAIARRWIERQGYATAEVKFRDH